MDPQRFDAFVRGFSRVISRRNAVAGALAASLLAFSEQFDPDRSVAGKKRKKKCKAAKGKKKCGKKCISLDQCCGGCGPDQKCCNGACISAAQCCGDCGQGQQCCNGACISTDQCCGDCGALTCCTGTCVDLASSSDNCGACGHACKSNNCLKGTCTCADDGDCSGTGCVCLDRVQGGKLCASDVKLDEPCDSDADCPLPGSFCSATETGFCTRACT